MAGSFLCVDARVVRTDRERHSSPETRVEEVPHPVTDSARSGEGGSQFRQRRGAGADAETNALVLVGLGEDGPELVRLGDDARMAVGDEQLELFQVPLEMQADGGSQFVDVGGVVGRKEKRIGMRLQDPRPRQLVDPVGLVHHDQVRTLVGADRGQDFTGDLDLGLESGIRRVDDVEEQAAVACFVEGRAEARDQVVGQMLDEADRVGDEDAGCV